MSVQRDHIRTLRESKRFRAESVADVAGGRPALVANPATSNFRCVSTRVTRDGAMAQISAGALAALKLKDGDEVLIWTDDAH